MSREWQLGDLEARLCEAIDKNFEPTWDRDRGEFTWGLGLDEEHPRGQYNAFLATAEAMSTGAWTRLSAAPLRACPQVVGVDFPKVALARARWCDDALELSVRVHRPDRDESTTFRIVGADASRSWGVMGAEGATLTRDGDAMVVTTPLQGADLRIVPGPG